MKLWNNYKKEMKIASRGFYFYVEIAVAVIILAVLLMVVPKESHHKTKEVCYCNISDSQFEELINIKTGKGYHEKAEDEVFRLKPIILKYTDENGKLITREFKDKKKVTVKQYYYHDELTGKHTKTKYITDNFDDMLRIAYDKKMIGTEMWYENGKDYYHNILFGYETEKFQNLIKIAHGTVDSETITAQLEKEKENTVTLSQMAMLNNRENYIPVILLMLGGLMGVIIIIGYISVDKSEGVLKALFTTPLTIESYLMSKILVAVTTVIISSIIITVPVMGTKPDYILLLISIIAMSFLSCSAGTLISSFFDDVKSAYGAIVIVMIIMMLPVLSYIIPAFNPVWMHYLPSYYMIEMIKESLLNGSTSYVLLTTSVLVVSGFIFYLISVKRYKKAAGTRG